MIGIEEFRARIGLYCGRARKNAWKPDILVFDGQKVSLAIKIVLFVLLTMGNVERNPGPSFTKEKDELLVELKTRIETLEATVVKMETAYNRVNEEKKEWKNACIQLEERCERLESHTRRENLIFHNLAPSENDTESWEDCENKVRDHIKSMGIEAENMKIERAHRLNMRKKDSPIIVKFSHFKDKETVINRSKEIKKNKKDKRTPRNQTEADEVYIMDDYTPRVRQVRGFLRPFMEEAYNSGKKVRMSYDKLVIENVVYYYDENKKLTKQRPDVMSCLKSVSNQ